MELLVDKSTAFFALAAVLILSLVTVGLCRLDPYRPTTRRHFLFHGRLFQHALVSNLGAVFSVTYFFGATFLYASLYKSWTVLVAVLTFGLAATVVLRLLRLTTSTRNALHQLHEGNIFLDLLLDRYTGRDSKILVGLLLVIYTALLVEELAISRLVINQLFIGQPLVAVAIFATICLVVYSYLSIGGFRAVLNSDFAQGAVLAAFLVVLIYLLFQDRPDLLTLEGPTTLPPVTHYFSLAAWALYGFTWLVTSVDFYSRLNIETGRGKLDPARRGLALLSLLGTFLVVTIGIVFAYGASPELEGSTSATDLYRRALLVFLSAGQIPVRAVLLVGLFCMIFTTVDTLLLTALQVSSYQGRPLVSRGSLSLFLLFAVSASVLMPPNSVCAVGIFIGSLLILVLFPLLRILFPRSCRLVPPTNNYLVLAGAASVAFFSSVYDLLESRFDLHFMIPVIVLLSVLISIVLWQGSVALKRWLR